MGKSINVEFLKKNVFTEHHMTRTGLFTKYCNFVKAMGICCEEDQDNIKTILDIGANLGVYSYAFAFWFPNAYIHSFEPVPDNYRLLEGHCKKGEFSNRIKCHNFGFYKEEKEVTFGIPADRKDVKNTGLYKMDGEQLKQKGKVFVLSDWIDKTGTIPDFIKIDAEGADFEILNSSKKCLEKVRWITVEATDDCISLLSGLGFEEQKRLKNIKGIDFRRRKDSLWKNTKLIG